MNSLLWFILGFAFCRILQNLYIIGRITMFMDNSATTALKLLGTAAEDIAFIRQLKYQVVEKYGDSEQLKIIINTDEHVLQSWKRNAIYNFKNNYPKPYNKMLSFNTWDEAMASLDKVYKKEYKNKNANK